VVSGKVRASATPDVIWGVEMRKRGQTARRTRPLGRDDRV